MRGVRAEGLLRPDGVGGCGGAGRDWGAALELSGRAWGGHRRGRGSSPETARESPWAGAASVPVLLRVPTAGEGGSRLLGERKPPQPPPHSFLPTGGVAGCVEGPGQGTEPHGLGRKGL